jgi:spore coat polysaccharide biosynthesis protein SpsF
MNVLLITQARFGSTRLPGKVLMKIGGKTLLEIQLERLKKCTAVDKIILATTVQPDDAAIEAEGKRLGVATSRGSENDVLDRFYQAALPHKPNWVVRVTSDCPLLDWRLVDKVIRFALEKNVDYCSNVLEERFPDGQDVEVFKFSAFSDSWKEATLPSEREHVTPFLRKNATFNGGTRFTSVNYPLAENYSHIRMTVDEPRDFELVSRLIDALGVDKTWEEYTDYIIKHDMLSINSAIVRNAGYLKSLKQEGHEE